jgi:hypothetical protein
VDSIEAPRGCAARVAIRGCLGLWLVASCFAPAVAGPTEGALRSLPVLPIVSGDSWRYLKGTREPPLDWNGAEFDASNWSLGATGIGYGSVFNRTVLADMKDNFTSVYLRRRFHLPRAADVGSFLLTMDFDDAFVAYINGVEVARSNAVGEPPPFDSRSRRVRSPGRPVDFVVDGIQGVLLDGSNVLAVQGLNASVKSPDFVVIPELRVINAPPNLPRGPSPIEDAVVDQGAALLCVEVSDPERRPLDVRFFGRRLNAERPTDFTIVALPDTQFYSESFPEVFAAQTEWIVANKERLNIVFTTQLGDCVQNSNAREEEWQNADAALSRLEDPETTRLRDGMPYGVAVGNHDNSGNAGTLANEGATTPLYNKYFGISRFEGREYYGGHYGINNDNHYTLFDAGDVPFIAFHLEYDQTRGPLSEAVLNWVDDLLVEYADRTAMLSAHYLINPNASFSNQGLATYERLKARPNLVLMLCGHLNEAARRVDTFEGHDMHTVLSDYQGGAFGGNGWLRIMTYSFERREFQVQTYSPWLDRFKPPGEPHNFVLPIDLDPGPEFELLGEVPNVPSGGTACFSWPLQRPGAIYEWMVDVSDGETVSRGPRWALTRPMAPPCNLEPTVGADCDENGVHDSCDLVTGSAADCNGNSRPDVCDLALEESADCNANGLPDECELTQDCNVNGIPDACELASDCDGDAIPDECELEQLDCNRNGIVDDCDIRDGRSSDCNLNLIPDECDASVDPSFDCSAFVDTLFVRGDCDGDGVVAGVMSDAVFLLEFLFRGTETAPPCFLACDANGDGEVVGVISDALYLLTFNLFGGQPPPPPYPECGAASASALMALGCGARPGCP